jgi:uncharacterized Zn finger protein
MKHLDDVTPEQIGRCSKKISQDQQPFYEVLSENDNVTAYHVKGYQVTDSNGKKQYSYSCTCPAGVEGFAHVHHRSGVCKHVRWALAAALEERNALAELARKGEEQKGVIPA